MEGKKVSWTENPHTDWYPAGVYSNSVHGILGCMLEAPSFDEGPSPAGFLMSVTLSLLTPKHPAISLVSPFAPTGGLLGQDLRTHRRINSKFPLPWGFLNKINNAMQIEKKHSVYFP